MRALLRKDARWMLPLGLAGMVIGLIAMADLGGAGIWYLPDIKFDEAALLFHWVASGLLGLFAALFEDGNRTREYLLHRPISSTRLFWTRHLLGLAIVATWIVVLPVLHLAGTLIFHPSGGLAEPGRILAFINAGSVGPAFYAVPVFGVVVARRTLLGIVVAFLLSMMLLGILAQSVRADPERMRLVMVAALAPFSLILATALLVAAMRLEREGRDLDRPVSRPRLTAMACGTVVLALAGSAFLHVGQLDTRRNLESHYPKVARLKDGSPALVVFDNYKSQYLVDAQHRRIAGSVPELETVFDLRTASEKPKEEERMGQRGRLLHGIRYRGVSCPYMSCYVGSDGLVHLYGGQREGAPPEVRHLGKAGGLPFSPRSRPLGYWNQVALMVDRDEGSIWRYEFESGGTAFTRAALPGDDRVVEELTQEVRREVGPGFFFGNPLVVRGERGVYMVERSGFVPAPADVLQAVERVDRKRKQPQLKLEMTGPIEGRATLAGEGAQPAFTHDYAPHTLRERASAAAIYGMSLLRAPVLTVAALPFPRDRLDFGNPTDDDARILLDPIVMHHAPGILWVCLLLGAILSALTFRRLGRLGVPSSRRWFWTAIVFCFGVVAYVVHLACENARAYRAPMKEETPAPLLIRSAA